MGLTFLEGRWAKTKIYTEKSTTDFARASVVVSVNKNYPNFIRAKGWLCILSVLTKSQLG